MAIMGKTSSMASMCSSLLPQSPRIRLHGSITDTSCAGRRQGDAPEVHGGKSRCHDRQAIKVTRIRFGRSEATEQVQVTQRACLRE